MLMLGNVAIDDVDRMRERLFVASGAERRRKLSAFWTLLVLAAIIASSGVVADSTATVIGAMIVAPLMTPILGTALAVVLADRRELMVNVALVVAGATVVVCVGYAVGLMHVTPVLADTNAQVAGRVSPKLIDLLAALATGVVGAFALVRSDVSDTLPGVAIAISLVPPLAVVGLTLSPSRPRSPSVLSCCSPPTWPPSSRPARSSCCSTGFDTSTRPPVKLSPPRRGALSRPSSPPSCWCPCR